jgi:hypothetical protein
MRNLVKTPSWQKIAVAIAAVVSTGAPAIAQEDAAPADKAEAPATRGELEVAMSELAGPLVRRAVVRNEQNLYDVWLISKLDFEKTSEVFRQAISAKRPLSGGLRIERWTWIDADRSYVLDVAGGAKPYRVRLTRHLGGAMLELESVGAAKDAPRWAPPYRPRPVLLPHGQNR